MTAALTPNKTTSHFNARNAPRQPHRPQGPPSSVPLAQGDGLSRCIASCVSGSFLDLSKEGRSFTLIEVATQAQGRGTEIPHLLQETAQPDCRAAGSIALATLAGNEYRMPASSECYECLEQLEDDVVNFLPSVADIDIFGREVDLIRLDTQQPLRDPIQETLRKHNKFQVVVRPCIEVGRNIWHFQNDNRQGHPRAVLVPVNDLGEVPDSGFYSAPVIRHGEVAQGLHKIGAAAWQSCHQLQIVKLPPSAVCLKDECCHEVRASSFGIV